MPKYEIVGPGYLGRSSNVNASRCVNLYPELNAQDGKSIASLVGTPGLLLYVDTAIGPIRGSHFFNNRIYFVSSNKLYSVDAARNVVPIIDSGTGVQVTLATATGRVAMIDNGMYSVGGAVANQLAFVDGQNVYVVNVTTLAATSFAMPAKTISFIGGYFMVDMGGARFGISHLYDGASAWNALAISTADAYPDNLMAVVNNHLEAWLIGEYSAEVWAMDGSANPLPFSRVSVIDYGTAAPHSVAKGSNTLFWLVSQRNGTAGEMFGIGMANGYGVEIVSPQAINDQISRYAVVSDAWGYCYTDRGHEFYVLTFPTANATWVYDATTKLCHERSYYAGSPYIIGRHIANTYVHAWGKHYVGSYLDGKIYEMSESYLTDDGQPIASVRVTSPLEDKSENANVFISKLQLDAETGTGQPLKTDVTAVFNITTIPLVTGPFGMDSDGNYLWVSAYNTNDVHKIDLLTNTEVLKVSVGAQPTGVTYANGYFFVASETNNTVSKIDPATNTVVATIPGFTAPWFMAYDVINGFLWVVNQGTNTVSKVNISTNTIVSTIVVGTTPKFIYFDGLDMWVANWGSNNVMRIQTSTETVIATIAVGVGPVCIANDGTYMWVTNFTDSTISLIDRATNAVFTSISTTPFQFSAVAYDGDSILITSYAAGINIMSVMNPRTFVSFNIVVGPAPFVFFVRDSIWIANNYGVTPTTIKKIVFEKEPAPQVLLSWSDDGGHTWSNDHAASMGKLGAYKTRTVWRRLGCARNRCFRVAISEPVKKVLIGSYMYAEGGLH